MLVVDDSVDNSGEIKTDTIELLTKDSWIGKFCYIAKEECIEDEFVRDTVCYHKYWGRWSRSLDDDEALSQGGDDMSDGEIQWRMEPSQEFFDDDDEMPQLSSRLWMCVTK